MKDDSKKKLIIKKNKYNEVIYAVFMKYILNIIIEY